MEEEEELKRFTDCVYFLASPLTCNKGIECEYRHSEIARLNPRECWYWLEGSCLNPSCAFRHPPLDMHPELSSEYAPSQDQFSTSAKKLEVPCYFYFNGFCNKGDRCSFLHGPSDASKVSITVATIRDAPQLENKTSTGRNMISGAIKALPKSSEAAPKLSAKSEDPKEGVSQSSDFKSESASPHTSTFEFEEDPTVRLYTFPDKEASIYNESVMYVDQNSEEEGEAHSRDDDWLESSPGFDVLVDDRFQNLGYEDDADYLVGIERDERELDDQFISYNYENCSEYATTLHEERTIHSRVEFDDMDEQRFSTLRSVSRYDDEPMKSYLIRERNFLPVNLSIDGLRGVDLRSRIRKGRTDYHPRLHCFPNSNHSSLNINCGHDKHRQYGRQRFKIGKVAKNKRQFKATNSAGQFRKSDPTISRKHNKEKRQSKRHVYSSDILRRPVSRKRVTEEKSVFSGPKTLDQIKEEKRRGSGNGNSYGTSGGFSEKSEDFLGPKPLSEILKDKRRIRSVVDVNNGIS